MENMVITGNVTISNLPGWLTSPILALATIAALRDRIGPLGIYF
jgi:hypothetical protein